jgi:hypothetical protein
MLVLTTIDRRGRRSDETLRALVERDRLMVEAAALFFAEQSSRSAAHGLRDALLRYREGAWRRECVMESVPSRRLGRLDGHCWSILRARDHIPSERVIRRAIDGAKRFERRLFVAHASDQNSAC